MLLSKAKPILVSQLIEKQVQRLTHILLWVNKQWGRTGGVNQDNKTNISIPISVTTMYAFVMCRFGWVNDPDNMNGNCFVSHNGGNSVTIGDGDYGCSKMYICVGVQQWGKSSSSGRATTTVTLPISMASAIYAVAISQAAASDTWSTWSSIVSNTQIKLTNNYGPGSWWLVIGKQQWGKANTSSDSAITIAFPITFGTLYCVTISKRSDNTSYGAMLRTCVQSSNNASFVTRGGYQSYCDWIAAGKAQQWGTKTGASNKTITISLNITFTTTSYIPYAVDKTYGQSTSHVGLSARANNAFTINHSTDGDTVYWSAIGYQQWGYNSNNAAGATTGFPISFASACYGVVHCSGNTGRVEGNPYITSVTTTTIKWGQYGLGYWIAFGV